MSVQCTEWLDATIEHNLFLIEKSIHNDEA